jgi:phenylalanyl-tRNA synthetase beta chain
MKYIYSWLKNILGIKVASEKQNQAFAGVVVGKILEIAKHPNADRLQIAIVDIGETSPQPSPQRGEGAVGRKLQIVCGAPNIAVGQKVPVALVGTKMPNGMEIKEAEIRGEKSFGMLCAKDELGIGEDHSGIFILDEKAEIGMEFAKYIKSL